MSLTGVDVSIWQGSIAWGTVAQQGLGFAIAKATEGNGYTDPTFVQNITAIRQTNLVPGMYHYARPDLSGPVAEADWFLSQAGWRPGEIIQLDFEAPGASGNLAGWALAWLDRVAAATGSSPLFYSYRDYINTRGGSAYAQVAAKYGLWIAGSTGDPQPPWSGTAIWQDAGQSHFVNGISGAVDYDVFFGSRDQLAAYTGGAGGPEVLDLNDPTVQLIVAKLEDNRNAIGVTFNEVEALKAQFAGQQVPPANLQPLLDQLTAIAGALNRIETALKGA